MARGTELVGVMMRAALQVVEKARGETIRFASTYARSAPASVDHSSGRPDRLPIR